MAIELKKDPDFERLTVPCTEKEYKRLEKNILKYGCINPITVWEGIILDGYKRYEICSQAEMEFPVEEKSFLSRQEATIWVCRQRVQSLSKSDTAFRYLVGKWFKGISTMDRAQKKRFMMERYLGTSSVRFDADHYTFRTHSVLSEELGIGHRAADEYRRLAQAMDGIAQKDYSLFELLKMRETKLGIESIIKLEKMDAKKLEEEYRRLLKRGSQKTIKSYGAMAERKNNYLGKKNEPKIPISIGIKEMPVYDPDMELRSLMLTIPTWMSIIARTRGKMDLALASESAKQKLTDMLYSLLEQVNQTMEVLSK